MGRACSMKVLASSRAFHLSTSPPLAPHAACAMYEQRITMCQVRPEDVQADHVELTIKGMFVPRADLYRFLNAINGETAYSGKMFNLPVRSEGAPTAFTVARHSRKDSRAGRPYVPTARAHLLCVCRSSWFCSHPMPSWAWNAPNVPHLGADRSSIRHPMILDISGHIGS